MPKIILRVLTHRAGGISRYNELETQNVEDLELGEEFLREIARRFDLLVPLEKLVSAEIKMTLD